MTRKAARAVAWRRSISVDKIVNMGTSGENELVYLKTWKTARACTVVGGRRLEEDVSREAAAMPFSVSLEKDLDCIPEVMGSHQRGTGPGLGLIRSLQMLFGK